MADLNRPSLAELIDLNGRRCVVTGAAKGIGLAITRRLTEAGAKVAMLDIDRSGLEGGADFCSNPMPKYIRSPSTLLTRMLLDDAFRML